QLDFKIEFALGLGLDFLFVDKLDSYIYIYGDFFIWYAMRYREERGLLANAILDKTDRYIPLGYSRKFWYDDTLSTLISSITSPEGEKRVFLDPNLLPLVRGRRVVIVDDAHRVLCCANAANQTGKTLNAIWNFLASPAIAAQVVAAGVLMKQGGRWRDVLGEGRAGLVVGVFESPVLRAVEGGWDLA
ncbi:hypothetical protein LCER1_G007523, partial [Lachnellula cervina]